ncbi:MAG TPA: OmpA family protein [Polyangia bacterium]|nr:OmpA family protein [Polyangia bacterium]
MHTRQAPLGAQLFRALIGTIAFLAVTAQAFAQTSHQEDSSFSVNLFEPAPGPDNFFSVEGPEVGDDMMPSVGLLFYYQHRPFVLLNCNAENNCGDDVETVPEASTINLVENLMIAELNGSFTFLKRFQVGLAIPLTIWQRGEGYELRQEGTGSSLREWLVPGFEYEDFGVLGDLRLHLKARILGTEQADGPMLSAAVIPSLPLADWIGRGKGFSGEGMLSVTAPRILFGYRLGALRTAANLGVKWREMSELFSAQVGHQLTYGLGLGYSVIPEVELLAEVYGAKGLATDNFTDLDTAPLLFMGGARFHAGDFTFNLAGGGGILSGVGVPQFQVLGGAIWAPREEYDPDAVVFPDWDRDGDGIPNDVDKCPDESEDFDGFEDEDGCIELDNDQDGVPDGYDSCPNEIEDKDGFQDEDGCPEPDNDEDGVCDAWVSERNLFEKHADVCNGADLCPNEAEDKDGFQDADGCTDPDNDGDGMCDPWVTEKGLKDLYADKCSSADQCPVHAEDKDDFEDDDGCPDLDNDGDGIADTADKCPDKPETLNGFQDDDGCPDKGTALVIITEDRIQLMQQVQFKTNSDAIIGNKSFEILDIVAKVLAGNPVLRVSIEGHTDDKGKAEYNRELSKRRSDSVKTYLAGKGIADSRMDTVGHGPDKPIDTNKTKKGRETNRRVEFVVIKPERTVIAPKQKVDDPNSMDFTAEDEGDNPPAEEVESMDFTAE